MKLALLAICLCAAIASSAVEAQDNIISNGLTNWLNTHFRFQMRCGFPDSGLPPLAPFRAAHLPVDVNLNTFAFRGNLINAYTPHLDTFIIRRIDFAIVFMRMDFDFLFPFITLTGQFAQGYGRSPNNCAISGSGTFSIRLNNVVYRKSAILNVHGGTLQLGQMNTQVTIGSSVVHINPFVGTVAQTQQCNQILQQQMPAIFNANQQTINQYFDSLLRPLFNNFIRGKTLQDLLNVIMSSPSGPQQCRMAEEVMDFGHVDMSSLKIEV